MPMTFLYIEGPAASSFQAIDLFGRSFLMPPGLIPHHLFIRYTYFFTLSSFLKIISQLTDKLNLILTVTYLFCFFTYFVFFQQCLFLMSSSLSIYYLSIYHLYLYIYLHVYVNRYRELVYYTYYNNSVILCCDDTKCIFRKKLVEKTLHQRTVRLVTDKRTPFKQPH